MSSGLFWVPEAVPRSSEVALNFDVDLGPFWARLGGPTWAQNRPQISLKNGPEAVAKITAFRGGVQAPRWSENEPFQKRLEAKNHQKTLVLIELLFYSTIRPRATF